MPRLLAFAALLLLSGGLKTSHGQQIKISSQTLANGMQVLVHEDHDVPSVAMYLFYKIGSRNERPGTTGISHYFEHMMFNGAKKYGPKQFDIQMEKNGGANNAYTNRDVTVYTDWLPRTALELMFDMESDRIRDLNFDPKIVESERGVVYSERRLSVDNNPFGVLYEQLNATAYTAHPYQWPVVGWASDIESWSMDDLKAHFRMGYAPNNCIMVVVGDVTSEEVMKLSRQYLEPIPRQEPPAAVRTKEPEQMGERRVVVERPAALPLIMVSYHIGSTKDPDQPALEVMSNILSTGRSSRLYRRMVDEAQLVTFVNAGQSLSLDPGQFTFNMQARKGVEPSQVETALYEELEKLARDGVPAPELQKAKNQLLVELYSGLKTIRQKANLIGNYEVFFGGHEKLATASKDIEKVTADDVKRVAAKYLVAKNRTVATLIPKQVPQQQPAATKEGTK